MSLCCQPIKICQCCGLPFSRERVQSRLNPHNCEPCVSWGQIESPPRPKFLYTSFGRKLPSER